MIRKKYCSSGHCDRWQVTCDMWQVTGDTWHMACDRWHYFSFFFLNLTFWTSFVTGANIPTRWDIQCLLYAKKKIHHIWTRLWQLWRLSIKIYIQNTGAKSIDGRKMLWGGGGGVAALEYWIYVLIDRNRSRNKEVFLQLNSICLKIIVSIRLLSDKLFIKSKVLKSI